jgi:uncharacterized protein (TIGR02284 family)
MAAPKDDVIVRLNQLIEACKDREQAYRIAADSARNQDLKGLLRSYQEQSARLVAELQAEVKRRGGEPAQAGSWTGWLTRGWQHLAALVTNGEDAAVIQDCARGEDSVCVAYESALAQPLPAEVRALVERHYADVKNGHDRLRALQAVAVGPT